MCRGSDATSVLGPFRCVRGHGASRSEASHTVNTERLWLGKDGKTWCERVSVRVLSACLLLSSGEAGVAEVPPLTPPTADCSEWRQAAGISGKHPLRAALTDSLGERREVKLRPPA